MMGKMYTRAEAPTMWLPHRLLLPFAFLVLIRSNMASIPDGLPALSSLSTLTESIPSFYVYDDSSWNESMWLGVPLASEGGNLDDGGYPYIRTKLQGVAVPHKVPATYAAIMPSNPLVFFVTLLLVNKT